MEPLVAALVGVIECSTRMYLVDATEYLVVLKKAEKKEKNSET